MNEEPVFIPTWQVSKKVRCLVTQRNTLNESGHYGFNLGAHVGEQPEKVQGRRQLLNTVLQVPEQVGWLTQVSKNTVLCLDDFSKTQFLNLAPADSIATADGSFTFETGRVCVVSSADCLPIFLSDEQGSFVAALHAGWQGLYSGIIDQFFTLLSQYAQKSAIHLGEIHAYFCPAISQNHYQVGEEFRQRFVEKDGAYESCFVKDGAAGKFLADIKAIATCQLQQHNVTQIEDCGICTYADDRFYSHRLASHQNTAPCGRFASMIWLEN